MTDVDASGARFAIFIKQCMCPSFARSDNSMIISGSGSVVDLLVLFEPRCIVVLNGAVESRMPMIGELHAHRILGQTSIGVI